MPHCFALYNIDQQEIEVHLIQFVFDHAIGYCVHISSFLKLIKNKYN